MYSLCLKSLASYCNIFCVYIATYVAIQCKLHACVWIRDYKCLPIDIPDLIKPCLAIDNRFCYCITLRNCIIVGTDHKYSANTRSRVSL